MKDPIIYVQTESFLNNSTGLINAVFAPDWNE